MNGDFLVHEQIPLATATDRQLSLSEIVNKVIVMIPTIDTAGQWAAVSLAGAQMDFEAWMASFEFDKVSWTQVR
jgi:hypothetical protein